MTLALRPNQRPTKDLSEFVRAQVEQLELEPRLSSLTAGQKFIVSETQTGSLTETGEYFADRFKLRMPYCGSNVRCEIVFNAKFPYYPPDFIFPDSPTFEPDLDNLPSLTRWNIEYSQSLADVLTELLAEFKLFQVERLRGSRLQFDYESLSATDDVEVYLSPSNGNVNGTVNFLIKLDVNYDRLPVYLIEDNLDERNALLLVKFQSLDGGRGVPQLLLSPDVQRVFEVVGGVRVLPYNQDATLTDYVPDVKRQLDNAIGTICEGFERRRDYINAFLVSHRRYLLEYDVASYSKISFLFNYRDFHFLLFIELTTKFPMDQPLFTFQSIYHVGPDGQPYRKRQGAYPYSPRWPCAEMVERARLYILEEIGPFQRESVNNGRKWEIEVE